MLSMAVAWSSSGGVVMCYVFMYDVIFAHKLRLLEVAAMLRQ